MPNTTAHYTSQIPLRYLHKGTAFVAANTITGERILARADMDGHAVSENYGARVGNHHFDNPEKDYINVKFRVLAVEAENAGEEYGEAYNRTGRSNAYGYGYGQAERPIGYSVGSRYGVNTSLHVKDGWVALVTPGAYNTYESDIARDAATEAERAQAIKIREAEAALIAARAAVEKAQAALTELIDPQADTQRYIVRQTDDSPHRLSPTSRSLVDPTDRATAEIRARHLNRSFYHPHTRFEVFPVEGAPEV